MLEDKINKILDEMKYKKSLMDILKRHSVKKEDFFSYIKRDDTNTTDTKSSKYSLEQKHAFLDYMKNNSDLKTSTLNLVRGFLSKTVLNEEEFLRECLDIDKTPASLVKKFKGLKHLTKPVENKYGMELNDFKDRVETLIDQLLDPKYDGSSTIGLERRLGIEGAITRGHKAFFNNNFPDLYTKLLEANDERNKRTLFHDYYISRSDEKAEEVLKNTINLAEAADIIKVGNYHIKHFIEKFGLGPIYRVGRSARLKKSDLLKWRKENKDILSVHQNSSKK